MTVLLWMGFGLLAGLIALAMRTLAGAAKGGRIVLFGRVLADREADPQQFARRYEAGILLAGICLALLFAVMVELFLAPG